MAGEATEAYVPVTNNSDGYADWPLGQVRYFNYNFNLSAPAAESQIQGLSFAQKLTASSTSQPVPPINQVWVARSAASGALLNQFIPDLVESGDPATLLIALDHYDANTGYVYYKQTANPAKPSGKESWEWVLDEASMFFSYAEFAALPHLPKRPVTVKAFLINPALSYGQQREGRGNYYVVQQTVNYI